MDVCTLFLQAPLLEVEEERMGPFVCCWDKLSGASCPTFRNASAYIGKVDGAICATAYSEARVCACEPSF